MSSGRSLTGSFEEAFVGGIPEGVANTYQVSSTVQVVKEEGFELVQAEAEQKEKASGPAVAVGAEDVIRFLRRYAGWLVVAVPFFIHVWVALGNLRAGVHEALPEFADVSGAGVSVWFQTYRTLFVRPETWTALARLYALWALVFLILSIYRALREDNSVLYGVALFFAHALAGVLILAVLTPTLWVLLAGWGPRIVELTPPLVLLFIGVILTIAARNASPEPMA